MLRLPQQISWNWPHRSIPEHRHNYMHRWRCDDYILNSATNRNVAITSQRLLSFIPNAFKRIEAHEITLWTLYVCVCVCVPVSILEAGGDSREIGYALYATAKINQSSWKFQFPKLISEARQVYKIIRQV
jgi:hypothetical protein